MPSTDRPCPRCKRETSHSFQPTLLGCALTTCAHTDCVALLSLVYECRERGCEWVQVEVRQGERGEKEHA